MLLGEAVTLVHLPDKVECFCFVGNDDVDRLAYFLLLVELLTECDDVSYVGYTCLIKSFDGISAFPCPCRDLSPVGLEMVENTFDDVVSIPEIIFVEFFNLLFFDAVDNVGDRLLQVKFLLKFLHFFLEGEYFEGA